MPNFWNTPGVPHKGWILENVIDVREEGQPEWDTPYETCMMCGHEKIRYVHIVTHSSINEEFRVGCNCAEKMTDDYSNPKELERRLRNKASRRDTWMGKEWKVSKKGNHFLKTDGHILIIFLDEKSKEYKVRIDDQVGDKFYRTFKEAKLGAFLGVEYYKNKGEW